MDGERRLAIGGRRQLALLAFLLLHANEAVSSDALSDVIWGAARSRSGNRLPMAIARLRRALEPLRRGGEPRLETVGNCYALSVGSGELDAEVFRAGVQAGRGALQAGEAARAAELLVTALGLWRGPPLAEVAFDDFAQAETRRLEELRLVAIESRVDAELQLGRHQESIGELEALVIEQPTREGLAGQLMVALYRCGRQADALAVYQRTRTRLAEELGLDPGPALKALQGQILEQAPSLRTPPAVAPAPLVPRPAHTVPPLERRPSPPADRGSSQPSREHRKTVTVLFIDIVDSTRLGAHLDPEALRGVMLRYYETVRGAIESHGGSVQKFIGDAVVGVFGVPVVHEDDPLRAVRAAIQAGLELEELNDELEQALGVRLETRAGINTGEVVVSDRADGDGVVVGVVLNVAARHEQTADVSGVLLGEATYACVREVVDAERVEPVRVKGKANPLVAYRLLDLNEGPELRRRQHRSPLVGRLPELHLIQEAYDRAGRECACHLFTVLGPAGVGKSRLVEEGVAACTGAVVLSGRCLPYGEGITFWPLGEILRGAADIGEGEAGEDAERRLVELLAGEEPDRDAGTIARILAGVIGLREGPATVDESFWAVRRLFEAIARREPLIVIFEDVHWAEPTLLDLIEHVAELSRDAPILIVCVARPELVETRSAWGGGMRNATSIHVAPLTFDERTLLIESLVGSGSLPTQVSARIASGSEGFPLYLEEMIAMLLDGGLIPEDGAGETGSAELSNLAVPPTIRALLAARLDGLSVDERRVLELASVVGREFWHGAIAAIALTETGVTSTSVLRALVRKDLIVPERSTLTGDDSFRFRHILIRDAAYDSLPKAERADLHERFASWLESSFADRLVEVEEIIGYHLEQAHTYRATLGQPRGDLAERAAARLGAAGRRALDVRASISLLERARSLSRVGTPAHRQLGLDIGNAFLQAGEFESARTILEQLKAEAEAEHDSLTLAYAHLDLAEIRVFIDPEGAAARCRAEAEAAMPVFREAGDHLGIAKALMLQGEPDRLLARWAPFGQTCERALEHLRIAGDRHSVPWVLDMISNAQYAGSTPIPEAIARMRRILEEAGESRWLCAHVQAQIAVLLAQQGCGREALDAVSEAEAILRDLGVEFYLAWLALYTGWTLLCLGRLEQAEERLREADQICERSGERSFRSTLLATLAQVMLDQGRVAEAKETALNAIETGPSDDYLTLASAHGVLARALAHKGDPEAERAARRAVDFAEQTDMLSVQGEQWENLAEVLLVQGRHDEAKAAFGTALDRFERKGATALADRVRARLERCPHGVVT